MIDAHIHLQHKIKLPSMPVEIRYQIYAFVSHGRIHISACLQPNLGGDLHDGYERQNTIEGLSETIWGRRLWLS
jgi:hypothetical protein